MNELLPALYDHLEPVALKVAQPGRRPGAG